MVGSYRRIFGERARQFLESPFESPSPRLKFENAMVKRESQRQKTENYKLTMKMTEIKGELAAASNVQGGGEAAGADPPPQKKQRIVVEQMPEDWKMKRYSESPKKAPESNE